MKQEVINELYDLFISKLEEDIMFDFNNFKYGDFIFRVYAVKHLLSVEILIKTKTRRTIGVNSIEFQSLDIFRDLGFIKMHIFLREFIFFFDSDNVKRIKKRNNKIFKLLKQRYLMQIKQDELKENEEFISHLPEERKIEIYRTAKLERILENEN